MIMENGEVLTDRYGEEWYVFSHKEYYLALNIDSSRSLELDLAAYHILFDDPGNNIEESKARKELDSIMKSGYLGSETVQNEINESDLIIHEVQLGVHTSCNLKCRYCFRHENNVPLKPLAFEKAQRLIEQTVEKLAMQENNYWFFFNMGLTGEALLDLEYLSRLKSFISELSVSKGKNIFCSFNNTNGTLLTPEKASQLWKLSDMTEIIFSIDGSRRIHNNSRVFHDGSGSYDRIESSAIHCNRLFRTNVAATLTGDMPYVTEIFENLYSLGFRSICIKPVRNTKESSLAISEENIYTVKYEYQKFVEFLLNQEDDKLVDYLHAIDQNDFFMRMFYRMFLGVKVNFRCKALLSMIGLDGNGDIYPCASFIGIDEFKIGNIFEDNESWELERRRLYRKIHIEEKSECKKCWARNLCGGGCAHSAFAANGHIESPDMVKCDLIRHLAELAMVMLSEIARRPQVLSSMVSRFRIRSHQAYAPYAACKETTVVLDIDSKIWGDASVISLDKQEQFRGFRVYRQNDIFTAKVKTLWDKEYFYLRVEVHEDEYNLKFRNMELDEDIIRFSITSDYMLVPFEYGIAVEGGQPVLIRHKMDEPSKRSIGRIEDAILGIKTEDSMTTYFMALPWRVLNLEPQNGDTYKFNVMVYERGLPYKYKAWYEWTPGMFIENAASLFGDLQFV